MLALLSQGPELHPQTAQRSAGTAPWWEAVVIPVLGRLRQVEPWNLVPTNVALDFVEGYRPVPDLVLRNYTKG